MARVEELAASAGIRIERVGGLVLVRADDARRLLDAFERDHVRVLGAEGFRVEGSTTHSDMDAILDLSGLEDVDASIREARRFVDEVATPDLLLEFVVAEEARTS